MRILVATDFSKHADHAIESVKAMTLPAGSHVRVINVIEPVTTVAIFASAAVLAMNDAIRDEARALARDAAKHLERPGVKADAVVGFGRPADAICDEARAFEPDLLVVGSRGRGAITANILGSVSAELIDRVPCPVLVARMASLGQLILADDGSVDASAGAAAVASLPPLRPAAVRVVSVVDLAFPIVYGDLPGPEIAQVYRDYEAALPALREKCATLARDRAAYLQVAGVRADWERREGDPAHQIIEAAEAAKADCIVIGSRGQTGMRRLVVGSVARSVLHHAPCSVLVTHARATSAKTSHNGEPALANAFGKEVTIQ